MTATTLTNCTPVSTFAFVQDALKGMRRAQARSAARTLLLGLDDHLLRDIGLTRADIANCRGPSPVPCAIHKLNALED